MAASSSSVSCGAATSSASDSTPPEAHVLMTVAPYFTFSRTACRASSAPWMIPFSGPDSGPKVPAGKPVRSQWPPVAPMASRATIIRGPGTSPFSMAFRRPTSIESLAPTSRTVVKPASRTFRAYAVATIAFSGTGRRNPS